MKSEWIEKGFECVDEGRPVFIKNGNAYALVVRDGKEQMRSISNLTAKEKDELMLDKEKIDAFEQWGKEVHKSSIKAEKQNEQLKKKEESKINGDAGRITNAEKYERNKLIATNLGFDERQNGLFVKNVYINGYPHDLYLDFRDAVKGAFYSYPLDKKRKKYSNDQLKEMKQEEVIQYIKIRDHTSEIIAAHEKDGTNQNIVLPEHKEKENKLVGHGVTEKMEAVPIAPLEENIDYYRHGEKRIFMKEGLMKMAPSKGISTDIIIEKDDPKYKRVKVIAWRVDKNGDYIQAVDYCDWDWDICYMRTIIKAIEKKKIPEDAILYEGEKIVGVKDKYLIPLASYFVDAREFALRTIIGKAKRRCWGELLGITTASRKELELMREEYDRIYEEGR